MNKMPKTTYSLHIHIIFFSHFMEIIKFKVLGMELWMKTDFDRHFLLKKTRWMFINNHIFVEIYSVWNRDPNTYCWYVNEVYLNKYILSLPTSFQTYFVTWFLPCMFMMLLIEYFVVSDFKFIGVFLSNRFILFA